MTSILYQRTERGNLELESRQIRLSARQRALLLLVESPNESILNRQQLQHLATPENIQVLIDYSLIIPLEPVIAETAMDPIALPSLNSSVDQIEDAQSVAKDNTMSADQISLKQWEQRVIDQNQAQQQLSQDALSLEALSFEQIKHLMVSSLKSYCGLLGFALSRDIQQASRMAQLRLCQMQWVTLLSESKADAMQVKRWISQLNHSYQHLNER